jgi:hypothetical protein
MSDIYELEWLKMPLLQQRTENSSTPENKKDLSFIIIEVIETNGYILLHK